MSERRAPGKVRDSVIEALTLQPGAASIKRIHARVEQLSGGPVPESSVRSYLRLNEGTMVYRTSRGEYSLFPMDDGASTAPSNPVFQFRNASLFHCDCMAWLRDRAPNSVHAVVTDPPYGLVEYSEAEKRKLRSGYGGVWRIPPAFDGHTRSPVPRFTVLKDSELKALEIFFGQWAAAVFPVLVPGAHVFIASNPLLSFIVANSVAGAGFERRGEIVRLTMTMRGGDRPKNAHDEFSDVSVMPRSMWEPWLLFRKPLEGRVQDNLRKWKTGGLRRPSADKPFGDVIASHPTRPDERALAPHPSLKPQSFLRQLVRASLPLRQGVVLDPFAGSGSTLAAAEAVGYESIGIESDSEYIEMAKSAIPRLAALSVKGD